MAGARLELKIEGLGDVRRRLSELADRLADPAPALNEIGEHLYSSTRERFRSRKAPDGTPWAPVSEAYARRKQKAGKNPRKILDYEGSLMDSLNYEADRDGLLFGSPEVYAGTHQFGRAESNIPARPFLGLSAEDEAAIADILADYLDPV